MLIMRKCFNFEIQTKVPLPRGIFRIRISITNAKSITDRLMDTFPAYAPGVKPLNVIGPIIIIGGCENRNGKRTANNPPRSFGFTQKKTKSGGQRGKAQRVDGVNNIFTLSSWE